MKSVRLTLLVTLSTASLFTLAPSTSAVDLPAFSLVVPCASETPVSTGAFGVNLPAGTYLAVVSGECHYREASSPDPSYQYVTLSEELRVPCALPTPPSVPCIKADDVRVDSVPSQVCNWAVAGALYWQPCGPAGAADSWATNPDCPSAQPGDACPLFLAECTASNYVYTIRMDESQCITLAGQTSPVGTFVHAAYGPVTARFVDYPGGYADNFGAFVVTFTRIGV